MDVDELLVSFSRLYPEELDAAPNCVRRSWLFPVCDSARAVESRYETEKVKQDAGYL